MKQGSMDEKKPGKEFPHQGMKNQYSKPSGPQYGRPSRPDRQSRKGPYGKPALPKSDGQPAAQKGNDHRISPTVEPGKAGNKESRGVPAFSKASDRPLARNPSFRGREAAKGRFHAPSESGSGRFGKPAGEAREGMPETERRYGRPANPDVKDMPQTGRRYGKPAAESGISEESPRKSFGLPSSRSAQGTRGYSTPSRPWPAQRPQGREFRNPPHPMPVKKPEPILSQDARQAALLVINRVLEGGAYASLSLDEVFQNMRLSQQDKRLAAVIVYKTIEDLLKLDFALSQFLQDAEALKGTVRNILRLSACQILLMDKIPDFAVVNEAVELTRASGLEDMTGLVNGVLRSLIRNKDSLNWPKPGDGNYLSVTNSMPQWLVDILLQAYPEQTARDIMAYRNPEHAIVLRRNRILLSQDEFLRLLRKKTAWTVTLGRLEETVRVKGVSDISRDSDFIGGRFSIQGEGSMAAVLALSPKPGMAVLDACAAPGGKTCLMAELMQNTGRVHAWDVHEHRVDLIYAQAERLRLYNVRPAVRDATVFQERFEESMGAVLLDAPCSGTGVMDNKPDIKHRLTAEGLREMTVLQQNLLSACARYVKPGGTLVYSTCSLLPQENGDQVRKFLETHSDFKMDDLPAAFPSQFRHLESDNGIQLLPHMDGVEGFFIARMRRI